MSALVIDNPARSRYELALEGGIAFIDYQRIGGRVRAAARRGAAGAARAGRRQAAHRRRAGAGAGAGGSVEARCPYVAQFIARNAQYHDLLASALVAGRCIGPATASVAAPRPAGRRKRPRGADARSRAAACARSAARATDGGAAPRAGPAASLHRTAPLRDAANRALPRRSGSAGWRVRA